jgi:tRNA(Ile)-lysidine synthase
VTEPVVAVAWSGGRDSTALLHATLRSAAPLGVRVLALHVHHGLSPNADAWLAFCTRRATAWRRRGEPLDFAFGRIASSPEAGDSVEAWARRQRYVSLRSMALAGGARVVLLAHHRRDQAETFVLQALRGAGVAGLAGMPREVERDGLCWARPWLGQAREAIEAYVRRHRIQHVDDESNDDARYARNRLRLQVWPALTAAFPHAEGALADSAAWAAEATHCLDDLACQDIESLRRGDGLQIQGLLDLAVHRRANVLRHWLKTVVGLVAPASLIERLHEELAQGGRPKTWPIGSGELRSHRGVLRHVCTAAAPEVEREGRVHMTRAGRHALPGWGGTLVLRRVRQGGVPLAWLGELELRPRAGGEQFQAGLGRPPRSLKKQYQAAGIPDWQRDGPLLFSGGQLVFVAGLGLDTRVIGLPGQPQVSIEWEPDPGPRDRGS